MSMKLTSIFNVGKKIRMLLFRRRFAAIGKHSYVNPNSQLVPENMYLDDYVVIQDNTNFISLNGKLYVKKYSVISSGCIIVPSPHILKVGVPFYVNAQYHIGDIDKDIVIEEDCWIGAGAILLPGVTIRRGSVVGAGAVVTKGTLPYSVVAGVPAKIIATKFNLQQVLQHEKKIYSESERLSEAKLKDLFLTEYEGVPYIGDAEFSEEDKAMLVAACREIDLKHIIE